eukprot:TRINITY_DN3057_c0_g1_i6.p2 TRINITY_DN3057_c0_g1~~TRINITY_DN3057_c0_g1_i6.p2  ORF type:complete len:317 (-),score=49.07 TRINITY_DN3057_c0_g1_i6:107-1057(-)
MQKVSGNGVNTNSCLLENHEATWLNTDVKPAIIANESGTESYCVRRSTDKWLVCTVAAQLRSRSQIRHQILSACGLNDFGELKPGNDRADALLFVSGSHPGRRLNGASKLISRSTDMLTMAYEMRSNCDIPDSVSFWAVANPNVQLDTETVPQKIEAGAEVIITQPPFLFKNFTNWLSQKSTQQVFQVISQKQENDQCEGDQVEMDGDERGCHLVVGVPVITSIKNLKFWFELCDLQKLEDKGAKEELSKLVAEFERFNDQGDLFGFNKWFLGRIKQLPCVSGIHLMPLNQVGRQLTFKMLEDDVFNWLQGDSIQL